MVSEKEIEAAIKAIEAVPIMDDTYSLSGEDAKAVARAALEAAARVRAENDAFQDAVVTGLGAVKMNADGSTERVDLRAKANVGEPVAWTGNWSLNALSHGYEGFIYPEKAEAHPIPLFTYAAPLVEARETIVAAAISHNGLICTMPQPARHHHILHRSEYSSSEEGFLTSEGRFVDRKKAAELAIKAGQIDQLRWPPYLYSEDLW